LVGREASPTSSLLAEGEEKFSEGRRAKFFLFLRGVELGGVRLCFPCQTTCPILPHRAKKTPCALAAASCFPYQVDAGRSEELKLLHNALYPKADGQDDHPGQVCYMLVSRFLLAVVEIS